MTRDRLSLRGRMKQAVGNPALDEILRKLKHDLITDDEAMILLTGLFGNSPDAEEYVARLLITQYNPTVNELYDRLKDNAIFQRGVTAVRTFPITGDATIYSRESIRGGRSGHSHYEVF